MSTGVPNSTIPQQQGQTANMSTSASTGTPAGTGVGSAGDLGIESHSYETGSGVNLTEKQKVLVGSVLDLFAGKPTLKKLSLWRDDATFADPLTIAEGRKQFAAQWYGLAAAFSEIERQSCTVIDSGNPIQMNLKTRYKVKGLGAEKVIESLVKIWSDESGSITKVEDRWNGNIPEGPIAKAFRNLNSVTVPAFVSVPKSEEEEAGKK